MKIFAVVVKSPFVAAVLIGLLVASCESEAYYDYVIVNESGRNITFSYTSCITGLDDSLSLIPGEQGYLVRTSKRGKDKTPGTPNPCVDNLVIVVEDGLSLVPLINDEDTWQLTLEQTGRFTSLQTCTFVIEPDDLQ